MPPKTKLTAIKGQCKIDSFFKKVSNDQKKVFNLNTNEKTEDDDDVIIEKVSPGLCKRKFSVINSSLNCTNLNNEIEPCTVISSTITDSEPHISPLKKVLPLRKRQKIKEKLGKPLLSETQSIDDHIPQTSNSNLLVKEDECNIQVIDNFEAILRVSPKKQNLSFTSIKPKLLKQVPETPSKWYRYQIKSIERDFNSQKLILTLNDNDNEKICHLTNIWYQTMVNENDVINISSPNFEDDKVILNKDSLLIVNPDNLISNTLVTLSYYCPRKAWLTEYFSKYNKGNKEMLIGEIVHKLFQYACVNKINEQSTLETYLDNILLDSNIIERCVLLKISIETLKASIDNYLSQIILWLNDYIFNKKKINNLEITKVHDIEDCFWSTNLGLKGKVDLSVECEENEMKSIIPIELKTGRPVENDHQAQVIMYTMMINETDYGHCNNGVLVYLKNEARTKSIDVKPFFKSSLVQARNDLAYYSSDSFYGPNIIEDRRKCEKCDFLECCSLMNKSFKKLDINDNSNTNFVNESTNYLNSDDIDFFKKWFSLIELERNSSYKNKDNKKFWSELSINRELKGVAFSNMIIDSSDNLCYYFRRDPCKHALSIVPLTKIGTFRRGDMVIISQETNQSNTNRICLATGFIISISDDILNINLDKKINKNYEKCTFRIDKHQSFSASNYHFHNLLQLYSNEDNCKKLRDLVISVVEPKFKIGLKRKVIEICKLNVKDLNKAQQKSILKACLAEDYCLIQGTPGAGKTSTVVTLVKIFNLIKKTILITSYTHSSLDNILLKLKKLNIDFVRIGSVDKIHSELQSYSLSKRIENIRSTSDLNQFYKNITIVASPCLSVNNQPLFQLKHFDYCIFDEAGQVNLPASLGPLFLADTFILVGDHKQLPPLVTNNEAISLGMEETLFARLQKYEKAIIKLNIQYRMNKEIMRLSSELCYDSSLDCGREEISEQTLQNRNDYKFEKHWLNIATDNNLENSVIFLDTYCVPANEIRDENGYVTNEIEALLVNLIIESLFKVYNNLKEDDIGIITPYKKQVEILKHIIKKKNIEINTVDQYQGRDKEIIIISSVISADKITVNYLFNDERRLNVAITRAKRKLIIIGCIQTLNKTCNPFERLFSILHEHQVIKLPCNAHV